MPRQTRQVSEGKTRQTVTLNTEDLTRVQAIADSQYDGNTSMAIRSILRTGLDKLDHDETVARFAKTGVQH